MRVGVSLARASPPATTGRQRGLHLKDDAKNVTHKVLGYPQLAWHHHIQACPVHEPTNRQCGAHLMTECCFGFGRGKRAVRGVGSVLMRMGHVCLLWSHPCMAATTSLDTLFTGVLNETLLTSSIIYCDGCIVCTHTLRQPSCINASGLVQLVRPPLNLHRHLNWTKNGSFSQCCRHKAEGCVAVSSFECWAWSYLDDCQTCGHLSVRNSLEKYSVLDINNIGH